MRTGRAPRLHAGIIVLGAFGLVVAPGCGSGGSGLFECASRYCSAGPDGAPFDRFCGPPVTCNGV